MSWIDLFPIVLVVAYGVGGYFSGLIRRAIGLLALFVACWAATNMGLQAGGILQQSSNYNTPDARVYGFFGILFGLLVIVEVATQIAHKQIQIPAIVLNRTLGTALGLVTAILLSVIAVYELGQAANPVGGGQLDQFEQSLRNSMHSSLFMAKLVNAVNPPIIAIFSPFLPADPQTYFGPGPVT